MKGSIVIVGAGALGSHLILFARNFTNPIRVVDFDRVEQKNILSQFHTKMGSGKNKALALQQALQGMFGVKIEVIPHKLTPDNAQALLGGAGLVVDCTDNAAARRCIQAFVRKEGIPCVHGCLSATGDFAQVVWDETFKEDEEGVEGQATCENGENLPFHAFAASQIALVVQKFLKSRIKTSYMLVADKIVRLS
ncbi:MAG: ThiF family adenylyltransferase [Bacteroidota bacterium]|jgi:molybdopterin/thiamine biosynthesis adenylyltransferase